jgi:hypothetical protein
MRDVVIDCRLFAVEGGVQAAVGRVEKSEEAVGAQRKKSEGVRRTAEEAATLVTYFFTPIFLVFGRNNLLYTFVRDIIMLNRYHLS